MEDGIDPCETLHHYLGNVMNDIVFGKVYKENDEVWKWLRHLQEEGVKHVGIAGPLNFLPFFRYDNIPDFHDSSRRFEAYDMFYTSLTKSKPHYCEKTE